MCFLTVTYKQECLPPRSEVIAHNRYSLSVEIFRDLANVYFGDFRVLLVCFIVSSTVTWSKGRTLTLFSWSMLESSRFLEEESSKSRKYMNAHGVLVNKKVTSTRIRESVKQDFRWFVVIQRIIERSLNPVRIFCLLVALISRFKLSWFNIRIDVNWYLSNINPIAVKHCETLWNTESQIWNSPATKKKHPMNSYCWSAVKSRYGQSARKMNSTYCEQLISLLLLRSSYR